METALRLERPGDATVKMEPETVLPAQFFTGFHVDASLQPEKRLMLAVLEDAVGTFQKYATAGGRRGRRLFAEAEEWFAAEDDGWPFAFTSICQALGFDPEYLRRGLARWRDQQVAQGEEAARIVRFPFRRVNGRRHSITGRPVGIRRAV
jgi:hypothetical protein